MARLVRTIWSDCTLDVTSKVFAMNSSDPLTVQRDGLCQQIRCLYEMSVFESSEAVQTVADSNRSFDQVDNGSHSG